MLDISVLNKIYKKWNKRTLTGVRADVPLLSISKELRELGYKKGDEVIIGVREDGVIEVRPIDMQGLQEGNGGQDEAN